MKLNIFAGVVSFAVIAACAQTPLPQLRIEPVGGGSVFFVMNGAPKPLTAYLIELVDYPGSSYALAQDEIGGEPIAPGKEKRIQVGNMTVGAVPDYVKVRAAIFADGSTAGIPEKVTQLIDHRRETLKTVRETIQILGSGLSKDEIAAKLKQASRNKLVTDTVARLEKESVQDVIAGLRVLEGALAGSKPEL